VAGALSARLVPTDMRRVEPRPEDLLVKSLNVLGGEAESGADKTAFARVVMSGVELGNARGARPLPREEAVVLKLEDAVKLAAELRGLLNALVRSTPTPDVPASGTWSWTRVPPLAEDLLVTRASAKGTAVSLAGGVRFTVRVDLTGSLMRELCSASPPLHARGAIFSGARQIQTLVSSLRKVVCSALEQQRTEIYQSAVEAVSAFGF
jgi:hypothetical protein